MSWEAMKLGDVLPFKYGRNLPESKRTQTGEYDVVTSAGVAGSHCEALTTGPSVVVGRKGTIGKLTYCGTPVWPTDTAFFVEERDGVNLRFAYYLLSTLPFQSMNNDSAVPGLNRRDAEDLIVRIPSLQEQNSIADVLGALDDKIAENQRVLQIANELLRVKYLELMDGPLTVFSGIAAEIRQKVDPQRVDAQTALISLEHFDSKSIWLDRWGTAESVESTKSKFQSGDLLFGKLRPYFHKVSVAANDGICSTDVLVIRAKDPAHQMLVALAGNSDAVVDRAVMNSNGTRMPRAKWADIADCVVPDPGTPQVRKFCELGMAMFHRAQVGILENQTLARTRDELLPLLMDGKITVAEANGEIEAMGVGKHAEGAGDV